MPREVCPKCGGNIFYDADGSKSCLQCGYHRDPGSLEQQAGVEERSHTQQGVGIRHHKKK
jgi:uncharacterized Zn finger protein (UPF0148 family)